MDKTALQTAIKPAAAVGRAGPSTPVGRPTRGSLPRRALKAVASLRLTVWLFVLSFFLVFCGTLAQMDNGIWTVLNDYFRSAFVWIPFQVFVRFGQVFFNVPKTLTVAGSFPYPGGWLLGGLLLVNLLAAHAVRFQLTWKRSGILILHSGIIVMMLSELIAGMYAVEGKMTIRVGETANYIERYDHHELAIVDRSDPKTDSVVAVPASRLRPGKLIQDEKLPFDIRVVQYMVNSTPPRLADGIVANPANAGDGREELVLERGRANGVDADQKMDVPSAYVEILEKGTDKSLGTYLTTVWWAGISEMIDEKPQQVAVGGKTYEVSLRPQRIYKPYQIQLEEFKHEVYVGTATPKNFSSKVRLIDPERGEDRETLIYMNNPLRYAGETFYQSGYLPDDSGTILQVVRNPGWLMPYISCAIVTLGLLIHFGMHLVQFLSRRAAS